MTASTTNNCGIIRAFLALPPEALPSATFVDPDEPGDAWQSLRDYLTDDSTGQGVEVRLHADRPGWQEVCIVLAPAA